MITVADVKDLPYTANLQGVQNALQALITQLLAVETSRLDPALATQLRTLTQACLAADGLQGGPDVPVDRAVFDRLLALAGPETAPDLLDRLAEDLHSVRQMLDIARHKPDWPTLRMQSHILIGLAGAVGAETLCAKAQNLNGLAQEATDYRLAPVLDQVMPQLGSLIRFVELQRAAPIAAQ